MILLLSVALAAASADVDAERSAWKYKRPVTAKAGGSIQALILPPELSIKAAPSGRDFRLVDETGREVPFLIDTSSEREGLEITRARISDVRREKLGSGDRGSIRTQWTLDLGYIRSFSDLSLSVPDSAFAWHVTVETSSNDNSYKEVHKDASLFDQVWNGERVRKTDIRFDSMLTARFVRITARSAADSPTLELEGASVTRRRRLKGDVWSVESALSPADEASVTANTTTRYRLDASSLLPFDSLEVDTDDLTFVRRVRLIEETARQRGATKVTLGEGRVFRLRSKDAVVAGENTRLDVRSGSGGTLYVEIDNAGSPPLSRLRVRLRGARVRLIFPTAASKLTLYYGNENTRAPGYDLEALRPRLTQDLETEPAGLGAEMPNGAYKREPPLRFAAGFGATLNPAGWRQVRVVSPILEEDVYSITLRAQDLVALRPDLGDLRVVDDQSRQVPFLLDRDFAEERLPFRVERRSGASGRSRFGLKAPFPVTSPNPPSIERLELEVADPFFERSARILRTDDRAGREPPFSLTLTRRPPTTTPLVVGAAEPIGDLELEIDDGDNAPLDVRAATGILRVPRVVFKAAPGSLRLLLGNSAAEAPRYDLALLRGELLAYSAIKAAAGALTPNEESRQTLFSRVEGAPRGALVWTAIVVAIVVLLGLTIRTLKGA